MFSFLAFFDCRTLVEVLDTSSDRGRFRDPFPTISQDLLPSRTRRLFAACDFDLPRIFVSVHAARTNTWKLYGPSEVELNSSETSIGTDEISYTKIIRYIYFEFR